MNKRIEVTPVLGGVEITVGGVTLRMSFSDFTELFLAMQETRCRLNPRFLKP
jgi:hypothetical protein